MVGLRIREANEAEKGGATNQPRLLVPPMKLPEDSGQLSVASSPDLRVHNILQTFYYLQT